MDPGATVEGAEGNGGHREYIVRKAYHMRSWNNIYHGFNVLNGYSIN